MTALSSTASYLESLPTSEKVNGIPAHDITAHASYLELTSQTSIRPLPHLTKTTSNSSSLRPRRSHSIDTISLISADDFHELRNTTPRHAPQSLHVPPTGLPAGKSQSWLKQAWVRNKGLALVAIAQLFGVLMNIMTRMLELEGNNGKGMHPFQILFARMSITFVLCMLYMWWQKTPDFPFGPRGVRFLLVARAVGGFFGVFGLYSSLQYLPLSDATVLTFLAPSLASYLCSKFINEPFGRAERIGGFISFIGVILIARPTYLFGAFSSSPSDIPTDAAAEASPSTHEVSPSQRLAAVGMAMIGVLGATCAYTTIRWIGKRAHPLISVNYFAAWCTLVATIALTCVPSIPFVLPANLREWTLLFFLGISGFVLQFLLTAGLRYEKSSRATNMVYTQLLFALAGDKLVFGESLGMWSLGGSALILGSALVVAVQKGSVPVAGKQEAGTAGGVDGSIGMSVRNDDGATGVTRHGAADFPQTDEEMGLMRSPHAESDDDDNDDDDFERQPAHYSIPKENEDMTAETLEMDQLRHLDRDPAGSVAAIEAVRDGAEIDGTVVGR